MKAIAAGALPGAAEGELRETMRTGYLLMVLLALASAASGQDFGICPTTIRVEPQKLASLVAGWSVVANAPAPHQLKAVAFFDGDPKGGASLAPDRSARLQQTWEFGAQSRTYWMTCQYTGTTITLGRPLPKRMTECTAAYAPNVSIDGLPVIQKLDCK